MDDNRNTSATFKPFVRLKDEDGSEAVYYSLFCKEIPEDFKNVALNELNETGENKQMGILKLREFLEEKKIDVEDSILLTVLRNCKFNINNSKKKLMNFLKTINNTIDWIQTVDMKRLEVVFDNKVLGLLPYRDVYGRCIMYATPYDLNFDLLNLDEAALCAFCLVLYVLSFPLTTVTGVDYIVECDYPDVSKAYPVIKSFIRYATSFMSVPIRVKRIDYINEFPIVKWGYNMMRPLLPSKVKKRLQFHGSNIQNLQKFYHPAILPTEFGGSMSPMNPEYIKEDVLNFIKELKSRKKIIIE